jgi:DNA invertase Pin-like site-specific DNA recombinase
VFASKEATAQSATRKGASVTQYGDIRDADVVTWYGSICYLCDKAIDLSATRVVGETDWEYGLHIDHIVPKVLGGSNERENLRPTHAICNIKKNDLGLLEYFRREHPEKLRSLFLHETEEHTSAPRGPQKYGYIRVNSTIETSSKQSDLLSAAGVDRIFSDVYITRKSKVLPGLSALMSELKSGDILYVERLDRLSLSTKELVAMIVELKSRNVALKVVESDVDTTQDKHKNFYDIFLILSEAMANMRKESTNVGLAAARSRGKNGGRPSKLTEEQQEEVVRLYDEKKLTVGTIAKMFDIARPTVYRVIKNQ